MSVRDPRGRQGYGSSTRDAEPPLADLSDRLSAARQAGAPAPEELERLVSMIARREIQPDDRLSRALEGLANWAETARPAAQQPERAPSRPAHRELPRDVEDRLASYARAVGDVPPAPAPAAKEPPPIASLRAALADIADRQKALDADDRYGSSEQRRQPLRQPEPVAPSRAAPAKQDAWRPAGPQLQSVQSPAAPHGRPAEPQRTVDAQVVREMRDELDRLGRSVGELPNRAEIDRLAREMGELARRLGTDRPARLDPESLKAIGMLVGEVDRMRGDAASPQMIDGLGRELKAIAARLDAIGPRNEGALDALADRIDGVRAELEQFPRITAVESLARDIQKVVGRLDAQERAAAPTRLAVEGLSGRVEALDGKIDAFAAAAQSRNEELYRANEAFRVELDGLPRAAAVSDLGRQIDALTEGLRTRQAPAPTVTAFKDLSGKFEVLDRKIESLAEATRDRGADLDRLAHEIRSEIASSAQPHTLAALGRKLDAVEAAQRDPAVSVERVAEALRAEFARSEQPRAIETLARKLDAVANVQEEAGRRVEAVVEQLREEIASAVRMDSIDLLARQIESLTDGLRATQPPANALAAVQDLFGKVDALDDKVDAIAAAAARGSDVERIAYDIRAEIAASSQSEALALIARKLDAVSETRAVAHLPIDGVVDALRGEFAVSSRSDELAVIAGKLDRLAERRAPEPASVAEIAAALRDELASASPRDALGRIAQKLDALSDARSHAPAFIDEIVAALGNELAAASPRDALARIVQKLDALAETRSAPSASVDEIVAALRDELAAASPNEGLALISHKLDALIETRGPEPMPVDEIVAALRHEIAAASPRPSFDELARQIEALTANLSAGQAEPDRRIFEDLASRVDSLGGRMDDMAETARTRNAAVDRVEEAVRSIAEQLVAGRAGGADAEFSSGFENQVSRLVDGLERNDGRLDDLNAAFASLASRIEQSCQKVGVDAARSAVDSAREALAGGPAGDIGGELADALAEIRVAAAQSERRTADTLDTVRSTLERLLDRMEDFEARPQALSAPTPIHAEERSRAAPASTVDATEAARAAARRALQEIGAQQPAPAPTRFARSEREEPSFHPIAELAPDHPLEPGSGAQLRAEFAPQSTAEQTAASFIAAARRAQIQSPVEDDLPAPATRERAPRTSRLAGLLSGLKARKRPLLIGVAATLVVFAALYVASGMTSGEPELAPEPAPAIESVPVPGRGEQDKAPEPEKRSEVAPAPKASAAEFAAKPAAEIAPPRAPAPDITKMAFAEAAKPATTPGATSWTTAEPATTGSIGRPGEALPDAIGGATLRLRAVSGDPSAQLEVADRLLDGRGVPADPAAAARWLEKAAAQGLAPAQHRLGSLYEKGRGVGRDVQAARRWYEQAAASGNVRAMHNLGVLHAEGGLGKPDYNAAVVWFRMAAERGLVDSEYNLAVLCARGLGGKRDLVEAYKWFSLASAQGDEDAGVKREEVAKALGAALPTAKAAVASFRPRPVDAAANDAPVPPGGWDQASIAPKTTSKVR